MPIKYVTLDDSYNDYELAMKQEQEQKAKAAQIQTYQRMLQQKAKADPNNWTYEQTEEYFKQKPAQNTREEGMRELFLEKKKQEKEAVKESIEIEQKVIPEIKAAQLRYKRPLNDEERAQAVVDLVRKDYGEEVPIGTRIERAITSPEGQAMSRAILLPYWTALEAVRGILGAVEPSASIKDMLIDSAKKGILEPEKMPTTSESIMKAYPNVDWKVAGVIGTIAELGVVAPGLFNLLQESLKKDTQYQQTLQAVRQTPQWQETVAKISEAKNIPIQEVDSQLTRKLWEIRKDASYFRVIANNLKRATGIDILSEAGQAEVLRNQFKLGQEVMVKGQSGIIKELGNKSAMVQIGESLIKAALTQITPTGEGKVEIPKELEPLAQEAQKYKSADEFRKAVNQSHLMDLSNPEVHNWGRAFASYADEPLTDISQIIKNADKAGSYLSTMKYSNPVEYKAITAPGDTITIYRAIPEGVSGKIRIGDYVALDKKYAQMHLDSVLQGEQKTKGKIISLTVPKKDIVWGEADFTEWAYSPQNLRQQYPTLTDFYNKVKLSQPTGGKPPVEPPKTAVGGEPIQPQDPVQKVIQALKEAKPLTPTQKVMYSAERSKRFAKARALGKKVEGEKGFYVEKSVLKGELPKVMFESIKSKLSQSDIDTLFKQIKDNPWLTFTDTLSAREGLGRLLTGRLPTQSELRLLSKVFPPEFTKAILGKKPLLAKLLEAGLQIANIPRSIMASFDLSFGGRQGIFASARYRKEFFQSWKKQFGMFGSEKVFQSVMMDIVKNPHFELAKESGIAFTNVNAVMIDREERFMSSWAERMPGIRASGRAYTGFANKFRMDMFSRMADYAIKLGNDPKTNPEVFENIANFVNAATGRGSLGKLERAAIALNAFFFSPRLMVSRLSLLNPLYYTNKDPFTRKESLKALFSFVGMILTFLGLAKIAGAKVSIDSRNADFGKIKIGKTRIEITGGFVQYIRAAAQLWTGQMISSTTGKKITLGEGYKPLTRKDVILRIIENKEAPVFSFASRLLEGKAFGGEKLNIPKEVGLRFVPMVIQDLYDLAKENPALMPLSILGIFGFGLQTYEQKKKYEVVK